MPVNPEASVRIGAFKWVPPFAQGYVRDLRARWALEEAGIPYAVRRLDATASDRPIIFGNSRSAKCQVTTTALSHCSKAARSSCMSAVTAKRWYRPIRRHRHARRRG